MKGELGDWHPTLSLTRRRCLFPRAHILPDVAPTGTVGLRAET